jgi:hypothetical protein
MNKCHSTENHQQLLIQLFYKSTDARRSCVQNPQGWFERNGLMCCWDEMCAELKNMSFRTAVMVYMFGMAKCTNCGVLHKLLQPGYKGFNKACSTECRNALHSFNMTGAKNCYHKLSRQRQLAVHKKHSVTMKTKIASGEFTPCTQNYLTHKSLGVVVNGVERKVRSTWELVWWALHPTFSYETLRLPYSTAGEHHTYIVDFVDLDGRCVYELKPTKYQSGRVFNAKRRALKKWAETNNMMVQYIDERYFETLGRLKMIEIVNELDMTQTDREVAIKRLRWYKNEGN